MAEVALGRQCLRDDACRDSRAGPSRFCPWIAYALARTRTRAVGRRSVRDFEVAVEVDVGRDRVATAVERRRKRRRLSDRFAASARELPAGGELANHGDVADAARRQNMEPNDDLAFDTLSLRASRIVALQDLVDARRLLDRARER